MPEAFGRDEVEFDASGARVEYTNELRWLLRGDALVLQQGCGVITLGKDGLPTNAEFRWIDVPTEVEGDAANGSTPQQEQRGSPK